MRIRRVGNRVKKVDRSEYGRLKYVRGEMSVSSKKVEVVLCVRRCGVCVCVSVV